MGQFTNGEQRYTYETFGKQVEKVRALLDSRGITPSGKVAILAENMHNCRKSCRAYTARLNRLRGR